MCQTLRQILMKAKSGNVYKHLHFPVKKPQHTGQVASQVTSQDWCK